MLRTDSTRVRSFLHRVEKQQSCRMQRTDLVVVRLSDGCCGFVDRSGWVPNPSILRSESNRRFRTISSARIVDGQRKRT